MVSSFDWLNYLEVADALLRADNEGSWRSATSRSYYGVFGRLREILETKRGAPFPRRKNIHMAVISALKTDTRPAVIRLGQNLDRLRRERNRADYDALVGFGRQRAVKAKVLADGIASNVSQV